MTHAPSADAHRAAAGMLVLGFLNAVLGLATAVLCGFAYTEAIRRGGDWAGRRVAATCATAAARSKGFACPPRLEFAR